MELDVKFLGSDLYLASLVTLLLSPSWSPGMVSRCEYGLRILDVVGDVGEWDVVGDVGELDLVTLTWFWFKSSVVRNNLIEIVLSQYLLILSKSMKTLAYYEKLWFTLRYSMQHCQTCVFFLPWILIWVHFRESCLLEYQVDLHTLFLPLQLNLLQ